MRHGLAACVIAATALFASAPAGAAPFAMPLGPDRLVLDVPAGFADSAGFSSPRLTEVAEGLTNASNRVLIFALADSDARRFSAGDAMELRRYLLAVTPRATERERMGPAPFAVLVESAGRSLGEPPANIADIRKYLKERAPQQAHLLAELRRDTQVLSVMQGTMVPQPGRWIDDPPIYKVSTMTLALIGGRAVYLSAFSTYDGPADIEWVKTVAERWVEDLRRLNK